ncbi:MAG: ribosome silencing factor [Synergistaceae bacterium]|nr:ribosome silencing factor [Synergistaceae bacterium]
MAEEFYREYMPIINGLLDKHAIEVSIYDLSEASSFTEIFIVAIARSNIHSQTLKDRAEEILDSMGLTYTTEGENGSKWTLMDGGHIVINILTKDGQSYYNLDSLWGDVPNKKFFDLDD